MCIVHVVLCAAVGPKFHQKSRRGRTHEAFDHVGLLSNGPPGSAELPFIQSSDTYEMSPGSTGDYTQSAGISIEYVENIRRRAN
jgi:hypothetical protein